MCSGSAVGLKAFRSEGRGDAGAQRINKQSFVQASLASALTATLQSQAVPSNEPHIGTLTMQCEQCFRSMIGLDARIAIRHVAGWHRAEFRAYCRRANA